MWRGIYCEFFAAISLIGCEKGGNCHPFIIQSVRNLQYKRRTVQAKKNLK
ncbi:MAG: hypothetical protein ACI90V_014073 [Bacillariaceae sp.]|jgi:hypothetical protein